MVRNPSPRLIRDPDERAAAAVSPPSVIIRPPAYRHSRPPDPVPVVVDIHPGSVSIQIGRCVAKTPVEIPAAHLLVTIRPSEEPALEIIHPAARQAVRVDQPLPIHLPPLAGAQPGRAAPSSNLDRSAEDCDQIPRRPAALDSINRIVEAEICRVPRVDPQRIPTFRAIPDHRRTFEQLDHRLIGISVIAAR